MGTEPIHRPDWSFDTPERNQPQFPDVAAAELSPNVPAVVNPADQRPTFTAEDLAHIDSSGIDTQAEAPTSKVESTQLAAIEQEIEQIQKIMREDRPLYNLKYAVRYGELLAAREAATETTRQDALVQGTIQAVLDGVADAAAFEAGFNEAFNSLSEEAQAIVRHELANPGWEPARPASDADIERFASTPEGKELVAEWGRNAGRKVATVKARVERMLDGDTDALGRWVDSLAPMEAKALWKALAGT